MDKDETFTDQSGASADWQDLMNEYVNTLFKPWAAMFQPQDSKKESPAKGRLSESMQGTVRLWQTLFGAMIEPSALEHLQKASEMTPEIALGLAQTCLHGMSTIQARAGEWIEKRGAALSAADVQELDRELMKNLVETYEKDFSRFLKLPQVGMSRIYQERMLQTIDKQNTFQLTLTEFLHTLYMPFEKSFKELQEKMIEMAETGSLDEKSKTYYNLWIRLLEGHYMELFKRPEYSDIMSKTLCALNEFVATRQTVINDLLKQANVPTSQDLDDLAKEIYLLKKRVRQLEQEKKNNTP